MSATKTRRCSSINRVTFSLIGLLSICASAIAGESDETMTEMINQFSDCAGFYSFISDMNDELGKPETAQEMKNLGNGAKLSALYLLATDYATKYKKAKAYGDFEPYVKGRMDAKVATLRAVAERQEIKPLQDEVAVCNSLQDLQTSIVQRIRDKAYR